MKGLDGQRSRHVFSSSQTRSVDAPMAPLHRRHRASEHNNTFKRGSSVHCDSQSSFNSTDTSGSHFLHFNTPEALTSSASSFGRSLSKVSQKSICPHCNYTASCPANLLVHLRSHTGERPFVCSECGASFTVASNLKRHRKTKHYAAFIATEGMEIAASSYVTDTSLLCETETDRTA